MRHGVQFHRETVTARPHETIRRAVQLMRDRDVDAVAVVNEKDEPVGFVTDRDIALAVVIDRCDPETSVCFIMSGDPATIDEKEDIAVPAERSMARAG